MSAYLKRTWFATTVFVVVAAVCSLVIGHTVGSIVRPGSIAFVVTPPLWYGLVVGRSAARPGRGAIAGALAAVFVWLASLILIQVVWRIQQGSHRDALGDWTGGMILFFVGLAGVPVCAVVGALLGALTAYLQRRWLEADAGPRVGEPPVGAPREPLSLRRFAGATWFAALMFVTPSVAIALPRASTLRLESIVSILSIVLITPPVWWWIVARPQAVRPARGALAGLAIATLVALVDVGLFPRALERHHPGADQGLFTLLMVLGFAWLMTAPFGTAIGALTAVLQRRAWGKPTP